MSRTLYRKVVLIGDTGVGKTSIRRNYMGSIFEEDHLPTLGADFAVKKLEVNGDRMDIQIWDLGGQRGFEQLRGRYFSGSHGAIFVFDLTNPVSFDNLTRWFDQFWSNTAHKEQQPVIILGNKSDLEQEIKVEEGEILAFIEDFSKKQGIEHLNMQYFVTSAKTDLNIVEAFDNIAKKMHYLMVEKSNR